MRLDVEPLHAGHAAQHSEQKALPKQQATVEPKEPMQRPIFSSDLQSRSKWRERVKYDVTDHRLAKDEHQKAQKEIDIE